MKIKNIIIGLVVLFMTACSSATTKEVRSIIVTTNVETAEVFVDGKPYGEIYGGLLVVNIPLDGIHSIMLKSDTESKNEIIDGSFNEKTLHFYFSRKSGETSLNTSNSKYDKLEEQLNNIKVKNEIKQELELERTKERVLKVEVQNSK
ncbi:hypothetical protein NRK67_13340 [Fusobacteria bacterium ZRK30]|nr:hypothetical protein NRK67_13340 [Fusobacteria bacterium ZRK30]